MKYDSDNINNSVVPNIENTSNTNHKKINNNNSEHNNGKVYNTQMDLQKLNIMKRLNRIEGQVKGIQRMVNEDKYCMDVLTQVAAVRAAINKVGVIILENYSKTCLKSAFDSEDSDKRAKAFDELVNTINKFLKFIE